MRLKHVELDPLPRATPQGYVKFRLRAESHRQASSGVRDTFSEGLRWPWVGIGTRMIPTPGAPRSNADPEIPQIGHA